MRNIETDSNHPCPEQMPSLNKISVEYAGNFSTLMKWNTGLLASLEKVADLRTRITIQNGSRTERTNIQQLGDTLVVKRVGDVSDIFRIKEIAPELEVKTDFVSGSAAIVIHDQVLRNRLPKEKQLDPQEFAVKVDKLVVQGLLNVIQQEKSMQSLMAIYSDVKTLLEFAGMLALLAGAFKGLEYVFLYNLVEILNYIQRGESDNFSTSVTLNFIKGAACNFGGSVANIAARVASELVSTRGDKGYNGTYFQNNSDKLNPTIHQARALKARLFLAGKNITGLK